MNRSGFSMLELLVVVMISVITMMYAVPAYHGFIENNRLSSAINIFISAMALARNESISRNQAVAICASSDGQQCITQKYEKGWIIFVDADKNNIKAAEDEDIVWVQDALEKNLSLRATNAFKDIIVFLPNGRLARGLSGNVTLCSNGDSSKAKKIIMTASGRIRIDNTAIKSCNLG